MATNSATTLVPTQQTPLYSIPSGPPGSGTTRRERRRIRRQTRRADRDRRWFARRQARWAHKERLAGIRNQGQGNAPESDLGTLADLFAGLFGQGGGGDPQGSQTPQDIAYVPGPETEQSGGPNMVIVVVVLIAGAAAYYWFVYRKKHHSGGT